MSSSQGTLLTSSAARITVANQQPSAVVIGTQAGRLSASVVSLHPVVVANSAQNRTIQTSQGPKVITQPAQGPAIQLTQVPTVAKLPGQQTATVLPVPVTVAVATAQTTRPSESSIFLFVYYNDSLYFDSYRHPYRNCQPTASGCHFRSPSDSYCESFPSDKPRHFGECRKCVFCV